MTTLKFLSAKLNDCPCGLAFLGDRCFLLMAPLRPVFDLEEEEILDWTPDAMKTLWERGWLTLWSDEDGTEPFSLKPAEWRGVAATLTWEVVEEEVPAPSPEETAELVELLTK
jgi:hypothetical protein